MTDIQPRYVLKVFLPPIPSLPPPPLPPSPQSIKNSYLRVMVNCQVVLNIKCPNELYWTLRFSKIFYVLLVGPTISLSSYYKHWLCVMVCNAPDIYRIVELYLGGQTYTTWYTGWTRSFENCPEKILAEQQFICSVSTAIQRRFCLNLSMCKDS